MRTSIKLYGQLCKRWQADRSSNVDADKSIVKHSNRIITNAYVSRAVSDKRTGKMAIVDVGRCLASVMEDVSAVDDSA